MRGLVDAGQLDPLIRHIAVSVISDAPERSGPAELGALLEWVRAGVRFVRDPLDAEYIQSPAWLAQRIFEGGQAVGDCDDMAVLFATLAEAVGYPTRFAVVAPDAGAFSHVYVEAYVDGAWTPADPSAKSRALGWAPSPPAGRRGREMVYARGLGQEESGGFWDSVTSVIDSISGAAKTAVPLLERYGVVQPVVGYSATGAPIYASATLPVQGVYGATYTGLTQTGPLGLSMGTWLLLGAGAAVLFLMSGRRR